MIKKFNEPLPEFRVKIVEENATHFIFSIPEEIAKKIPTEAEYLYCSFRILDNREANI